MPIILADRPARHISSNVGGFGGRESAKHRHDGLSERIERWQNGRPFQNIGIAENYLSGQVEVCVVLKREAAMGVHPEFVQARFRRSDCHLADVDLTPTPGPSVDVLHRQDAERGDDDLVLVLNVESVQVAQSPVPTVVRLERLKFSENIAGEDAPIVIFSRLGPSRFVSKDREARLSPLVGVGEVIGDYVQSGAKVMEHVSDDGPALRPGNLLNDAREALHSVRLFVDQDMISLALKKAAELGFEVFDVGVGPFYFEPGARKQDWAGEA